MLYPNSQRRLSQKKDTSDTNTDNQEQNYKSLMYDHVARLDFLMAKGEENPVLFFPMFCREA